MVISLINSFKMSPTSVTMSTVVASRTGLVFLLRLLTVSLKPSALGGSVFASARGHNSWVTASLPKVQAT